MACSGASEILCLGLFLIAGYHCARLPKLKTLDNFSQNLTQNSSQPWYGKLILENSLHGPSDPESLLDSDLSYQADMGVFTKNFEGGFGNVVSSDAAAAQIQKLDPKVECTANSMRLNIQDSEPGMLLAVERGKALSPLPLSKMPPSCGYTVKAMQNDLVLVAPYDGCFVAIEENCYVLPLRLLGLPVKMLCPLTKPTLPSTQTSTCDPDGIDVKINWGLSSSDIKVKRFDSWEPLHSVAVACGAFIVENYEVVNVKLPYSCLEKEDKNYILELKADTAEAKISCSVPNQLNDPIGCQNEQGKPCEPAFYPETRTDPGPPPPERVLSSAPLQQFSEQSWSQVYQSVHPYTQANSQQVDLYSQLMLPTRQLNPVSQPAPGAPGDPVQRDVLLGQYYQQQYLVNPNVGPETGPADGPTAHEEPAHAESAAFYHEAHALRLPFDSHRSQVAHQPGGPPPMTQPHGGGGQGSAQPAYCSESCPSGTGNCCYQLAFHQHYHHIVPARPGGVPFVYTGLPSLVQVAPPPALLQSPPTRHGEQRRLPGDGTAARAEWPEPEPEPEPVLVDRSNLLRWLAASRGFSHDRPHLLQPSRFGQTPRYLDAQSSNQAHGQSAASALKANWSPPEASSPPQWSRPLSPTLGHSAVQTSHVHNPPGGLPGGYYVQQVVQDAPARPAVSRSLPRDLFDLVQHNSGQRNIFSQTPPKGF